MKTPPTGVCIPWHEDELEGSIGQRFERQVGRHPDRIAVSSSGGELSYRELDRRSNRLAAALFAAGARRNDRVLLVMDHEAALIVAIMSCLRSGLVCVPLRASQPAEVPGSFIVCNAAHAAVSDPLKDEETPLIIFEELSDDDPDTHFDFPEVSPDALAFLVLTSGSTGRPKGVLQNHRNLLHYAREYSLSLDITFEDRVCLVALCSGGQGIITTLFTLLSGATLCMRDPERHSPAAMPEWMDDQKITVYVSAASIFRHLLESRRWPATGKLASVRLVKIGAEALGTKELEAFRNRFPEDCLLVHTFSCTEAGVMAMFQLNPGDRIPAEGVPVGSPVKGKQIRILDDSGSEVPAGESGEIVVQSRFLSPGYQDAPERTAQAFRLVANSEERLYHTSDLGRIRPDGQLEHLGRKDLQVKIRGTLVNIPTVEDALRNLASVRQAAVFSRRVADREPLLVACVEKEDSQPDRSSVELQNQLAELVPDLMMPHQIIFVPSLPRSPTGKVDRDRLSRETEIPNLSSGVAPRTPLETRVAENWCQALKRTSVGVYDHFFEIGGDSLTALSLISSLSEDLDQTLPIELLLNHPTIAQMTEMLEAGLPGTDEPEEPWEWDATLMRFRTGGDAAPIVFIPGGYCSENELLVFAGLLPYFDDRHPVSGIRFNFVGDRVKTLGSLKAIARKIGKAILTENFSRAPIIIGECVACSVAVETARWLKKRYTVPPRLILLEPGVPSSGNHPPVISQYFDLLQSHTPRPYREETHLVFSTGSSAAETKAGWWNTIGIPDDRIHEVPGDHHTYIRQYRKELASRLSLICRDTA